MNFFHYVINFYLNFYKKSQPPKQNLMHALITQSAQKKKEKKIQPIDKRQTCVHIKN